MLIASVALNAEPWKAFSEGELVAVSMGKVLKSGVQQPVPTPPLELTVVGYGEAVQRMHMKKRQF